MEKNHSLVRWYHISHNDLYLWSEVNKRKNIKNSEIVLKMGFHVEEPFQRMLAGPKILPNAKGVCILQFEN